MRSCLATHTVVNRYTVVATPRQLKVGDRVAHWYGVGWYEGQITRVFSAVFKAPYQIDYPDGDQYCMYVIYVTTIRPFL